jgi:integrase/recombinase XerD
LNKLTHNQSLHRYLLSLTRRNYSKATIRVYRYAIEKFFNYLDTHTKTDNDLRKITRQIILDYWEYIKSYKKDGKPYSQSEITKCIRTLVQLFRYLKKQNLILIDPTEGLPQIHTPKALPKNIMTKEEVENILNKPDLTTLLGFRNRAILETLYSTGIRSSELINLTIYDVDPYMGLIRVIQGKGKKDRVVPIGKAALSYIKEYISKVRPKLQKETRIKNLFISSLGRPVSVNRLGWIVRKYGKEANINKSISPHAFRHTCATEMLKGGSSVSHVQAMLGHAHIKTTQIYTRILPLDLKKVHQKTHPRERLKKKEIVPFDCKNKIKYRLEKKKK